MEKNMKKIYRFLAGASIFGLFLVGRIPLASAQVKQWTPRTVEAIQQTIEKNTTNGISNYTIRWGDTLYAISQASDVSVERLMELNSLENARVIDVGTTIYFNQEEQNVFIDDNQITDVESVREPIIEDIVNSVGSPEINQLELTLSDGDTSISNTQNTSEEVVEQNDTTTSPKLYALTQFMFDGIIHWSGLKFTYYSQSVLPGGGLSIPGRHVNADGYVADGDGYIVVANDAPLGTIIDTPFGYKGKVYDRGTVGNHFDVYIR